MSEYHDMEFVLDGTSDCYILNKVTSFGESTLEIPESHLGTPVKGIGAGALFGLSGVRRVYIPASIERIGDEALGGMPSLERIEVSEKNQHFTSDADGVLYSRDLSTLVAFPAGSLVGRYEINEKTSSIGKYAFRICNTLEYLKIPKGITDIGDSRSFDSADRLSHIEVSEENPAYKSYDGVLYNKSLTSLIKYPPAKESECFLIASSVEAIEPCAFYHARQLKSVHSSAKLTSIPSSCFSGCSSLVSADLPESVRSIGSYAFSDCASLKQIGYFPDLEDVGMCAFRGCSSLFLVKLGDKLKSLALSLFNGCSSLTRVDLGKSVSGELYSGVFEGCESLSEINIPDGITTIESGCFGSCKKLARVRFAHKRWEVFDPSDLSKETSSVMALFPKKNAKLISDTYSSCFWSKK